MKQVEAMPIWVVLVKALVAIVQVGHGDGQLLVEVALLAGGGGSTVAGGGGSTACWWRW